MSEREENLFPPEDPRLLLVKETPKETTYRRKVNRTDVVSSCLTITAVVGLATYGGYQALDNFLIRKYLDDRYTPAKREKGIEGIEHYHGLIETDVKNKEVVTLEYSLARRSFSALADYELKTDYDQSTEDFIRQQRYDLTVDGIDLLNKYHDFEEIDLDRDKNTANIPGYKKFDLTNTYDLVLLDAIIQAYLDKQDRESGLDQWYLAEQDLVDLKWLAQADLPVEIRERTFAYPDADTLPMMGRLYRTLEELGYPKAPEIVFRPFAADGSGSPGFYTSEDEIYLTEGAGAYGAVHEEGHHQADKNDDFSQDRFNEVVDLAIDRVREVTSEGEFNERTEYISDYASTNSVENYAEVMETYFMDGVRFRYKLKELKRNDDPQYEILLAEYNFMKEFFDGKEFVTHGEVFEPETGDVFVISDPDGRTAGIGLRNEPNDLRVGEEGVIYDGDQVEILEGPFEYQSNGEYKNFWKVRHVRVENNASVSSVLEYEEGDGYIYEEWLGPVLLHKESRTDLVQE